MNDKKDSKDIKISFPQLDVLVKWVLGGVVVVLLISWLSSAYTDSRRLTSEELQQILEKHDLVPR